MVSRVYDLGRVTAQRPKASTSRTTSGSARGGSGEYGSSGQDEAPLEHSEMCVNMGYVELNKGLEKCCKKYIHCETYHSQLPHLWSALPAHRTALLLLPAHVRRGGECECSITVALTTGVRSGYGSFGHVQIELQTLRGGGRKPHLPPLEEEADSGCARLKESMKGTVELGGVL